MWATLLVVALGAGPLESTDFIGFSRDAKTAALTVKVAQPRENGWDVFQLVRVVDIVTGKTLASYRASDISRVGFDGKQRKTKKSRLTAANPQYKRAKSAEAWVRAAKRGVFRAVPLPLDYESLRLRPDPDSLLNGRNLTEALLVAGDLGSPVGYHVIALTVDGTKETLAHFRREGDPTHVVTGEVRGFLSRDRQSIAVLNTFAFREGERLRAVSQVSLSRVAAKVATSTRRYEETGVQGMGEAWDNYATGFGPRVPGEYRYPHKPDPRRVESGEAQKLMEFYTEMLGGTEFTF